MRYTLIFELPDGRKESIPFSDLFFAYYYIKNNFTRIKRRKETLTLIDGDKIIYKPSETNILLKVVKDYYKNFKK